MKIQKFIQTCEIHLNPDSFLKFYFILYIPFIHIHIFLFDSIYI